MTTSKIIFCLFAFICLHLSLQAQDNCKEIFDSLEETETLAQFSSANGPASFKEQVENSSMTEILRSCENYQAEAWDDILKEATPGSGGTIFKEKKRFFLVKLILSIFKSRKSPKVSYKTELKTAYLIATYGYTSQIDIQKVKEFVLSEPWHHGLTYSSHLAVDILLMHHNDAQRDLIYHTYTLKEMERARDLYAGE